MNFKKLEVFGFKSFADKLEIKFNEGITGIVGPNGCGKSNVADAIRWVMGEQSAKLLRGSQMMDVIFNGTENRKSLSFCEVSLHFDNSTKIFPLEYDEIVISRKLYRSGESEYSLNKSVCRLKDILDLLRDCGIGKEGYSIIGQGRIDEVLSAKPEERRNIFEEACGISKFKVKKNETERKLTRNHDNLLRLNDILTEIERQLTPLSSQAENAKIYLELKEKLKNQEINNYICLYESINSTKEKIELKLKGINEEYNQKKAEYDNAVKIYENLFASINNIDKDINTLRNSQLSMTVNLEKQAGEYKLLNQRITLLNEQNNRLTIEIDKNKDQIEKLNSNLKELDISKQQKQEEYDVLLKDADILSTQFLDIVNKIAKGEDDVEDNQKKVIESISKLSEIKSNLSSLITEKNVLNDRLSKMLNDIICLKNNIEEYTNKKTLLQQNLENLKIQKNDLATQKQNTLQEYNDILTKQKISQNNISKIYSQISSYETKLKYLKSVKENYEGYNYSVKSLLSEAEKNDNLKYKTEGVIARLIKVPEKFETAINIALGQAMQNIVTKTQEDAKYLINYLKQNRLGRVTFLPMDAIKQRYIDKNTENIAKNCKGYIDVASNIIDYDNKYYNIITGLLGKTLVCDTIDNAVYLSRQINYSTKIVTLEGDVIHPFGAMTGGSSKTTVSNLLSYNREIEDIIEKLQTAEKDLQKAKNDNENLEDLAKMKYASIIEYSDKIHSTDIEFTKINEQIEKTEAEKEQKNKELNLINEEKEKTENRILYIENELEKADQLEEQISNQKNNADDIRIEHKEKYDAMRKQRDRLHEKTTNIKIKQASLYSEIKNCQENYTKTLNQINEIKNDIETANNVIKQNTINIKTAEQNINSVNFDTATEEELNVVKQKLNNLDKYKSDKQKEFTEADKKRTVISEELQKATEKRLKEESNLSKIDIDLDNMKDRIWEEYQITYDTAIAYRTEDFNYQSSKNEILKLKKQILTLGNVNVNAIEDYKVLKERYDELNIQIEDLNNAEDDLKKIISDLTIEMVTRFTKGFNDINTNFTKIFKELFGGGNAQLMLDTTETDNPLSAGIDIVAEPPGKKLQSISLLSGGERALTAIAILFAILKLRPMPFCVLDEIEAALDDVNARRFATYLKNYSQETQFIVITHRKPTMELADSLYGVTMQEKGVSKIVSVKLNEALQTAEKPA